jgi:antitoxin component YwqK of YwqJK toxin-antitoxin module
MDEIKNVNHKDLRHDEDGYMFYEGELFTGVSLWYFDTGQIGSEMRYVGGILNGWSFGWYKNGQKESETYYKNECVDGVNREWHENGQMKLDSEIRNGRSVWKKEWNEEGNLINEVKKNLSS